MSKTFVLLFLFGTAVYCLNAEDLRPETGTDSLMESSSVVDGSGSGSGEESGSTPPILGDRDVDYRQLNFSTQECFDEGEDCAERANRGVCTQNWRTMKDECRFSCRFCSKRTIEELEDCEDTQDDNCKKWKKDNDCVRYPNYMATECSKSCEICGNALADGKKNHENDYGEIVIDTDTRCPEWCERGYCKRNSRQGRKIWKLCPYSREAYSSVQVEPENPYPYPTTAMCPYQYWQYQSQYPSQQPYPYPTAAPYPYTYPYPSPSYPYPPPPAPYPYPPPPPPYPYPSPYPQPSPYPYPAPTSAPYPPPPAPYPYPAPPPPYPQPAPYPYPAPASSPYPPPPSPYPYPAPPPPYPQPAPYPYPDKADKQDTRKDSRKQPRRHHRH